jgi:hypothetical protein
MATVLRILREAPAEGPERRDLLGRVYTQVFL